LLIVKCKVLHETDIEKESSIHHVVLPGHRLIIDNLISLRELKILMDYSLAEQALQQPEYDLLQQAYQYYGVIDFIDTKGSIDEYIIKQHNLPNISNPHFHPMNNTAVNTIEKMRELMKTVISVQMRIIEYAEAFFKCRFLIKTGSIFQRKRIIVKDTRYKSPLKLNQAEGWLVPVHADNCKLNEVLECGDISSITEKEKKSRDVSVIAFLNELPENMGGEFTFIDADKRVIFELWNQQHEHMGVRESQQQQQRRRRLKKKFDPESFHRGKPRIPPPSRESIRRALDKAKRSQRQQQEGSDMNIRDSGRDRDRSLKGSKNDNNSTKQQIKFVQSIVVPASGLNYTMVFPRPGRVVIFNSSSDNIHAATNLVRPDDHRYTLFMFLTVDKDHY